VGEQKREGGTTVLLRRPRLRGRDAEKERREKMSFHVIDGTQGKGRRGGSWGWVGVCIASGQESVPPHLIDLIPLGPGV
jgi:hypothetical protein